MRIGFDGDLYFEKQSKYILERIDKYNKLYLEFGGKLFDDYHAARVLPGFDLNAKAKLLQKLKDKVEVIFCINAGAIEKNKIRADIGITYDMDVLRLIDTLREMGIYVGSVVITQYTDQPAADIFRKKLEMRGERTYIHKCTKGYPSDVETIVSDEGYGANPYIETTRPLVVVTAPGPGCGKLGTCLSQLYHEHKRGVNVGYAKFETFPIWNLPLKHPVNVAYEAATVDLKDVNMIDSFHLEAYGETTVNYNRDMEVFPVVKTILKKIIGEDIYQSPTDMGVNMAGYGIFDDAVCREAAKQEIIRRYYKSWCDYKQGRLDLDCAQRTDLIMQELDISKNERRVVDAAIKKCEKENVTCMALELPNGKMVTGKRTKLMNAAAAVVLNAIKVLADISDDILLISPLVLDPIMKLKQNILGSKRPVLNLDEVLMALSISAATNPTAEMAMKKLPELKDCEVHATKILLQIDVEILRKLGVHLTCEPEFPTKDLYYV